jgi:hypothetical protein
LWNPPSFAAALPNLPEGRKYWGTLLQRISDSKTNFDKLADRAIESARKMPPGLARNDALKRAGLLRLMADLAHKIAAKEKPIRGKKPNRVKLGEAARGPQL